ncbi:MAG: hypothetical protein R3E87_22415 [Burkholderiaceae bacterium]
MRSIVTVVAIATLAGCAAPGERIASVEPPDGTYLDLDCAQVAHERLRVLAIMQAHGARIGADSMANRVAMTTGVVFWPALFMISGNEQDRESFARAKGRFERLAWQWRRLDCDNRPQTAAKSRPSSTS